MGKRTSIERTPTYDVEAARAHLAIAKHMRRFMELVNDDCAVDYDTTDPLEAAGLVKWRKVTRADLAEPFADERGIVKGGMICELTPNGRELWTLMTGREVAD